MSDGTAMMSVCGLGQSFGGERVLRDVDFELQPGEVLGILGASGSGKTTLLRALAGLLTPQEGSIAIRGKEVTAAGRALIPTERRQIGLVFQDYALFPHMTVADNIAYGIHRDKDRDARVARLLERVELHGLGDRLPPTLSGGQRQRVALARALAPEPVALLLDEPFANLDGPLRHEMGLKIRELLIQAKASAILVTHDRAEAFALSDRIAILGEPSARGSASGAGATILQIGAPDVVYASPNSLEVARLTGPVTAIDAKGQGNAAASPLGELELQTPTNEAITVLVRRAQLCFTVDAAGDCSVVGRQFIGPGQRLRVRTAVGDLWIDEPVCSAGDKDSGRVSVRGGCAWVLKPESD